MLPKDSFFSPEGATQRNLLIRTPATEVKRKEEARNAEIARWVEKVDTGVIGDTGVTGAIGVTGAVGVTGAIGATKANNATDAIPPPIHPPVLSLNPSEFARRLNEEVEKERKEMEQQKCVEITRAIEEIQKATQQKISQMQQDHQRQMQDC